MGALRQRTQGLVVLVAAMVLPVAGAARPVTVLGSVSITTPDETPLADGSLTGFALIANPGLEKTIVQPIPPYTFPVFMQGEAAEAGLKLLKKDLDTLLVMANATAAPLSVKVTLRDAAATSELGVLEVTLGARETRALAVSDLLP